jgi:hypothetical protein
LPEEGPASTATATTALRDQVKDWDASAAGGHQRELTAGTAGTAEAISGSAARDDSAGSAHDHLEPLAPNHVSRRGDNRAQPAGPARVCAQER